MWVFICAGCFELMLSCFHYRCTIKSKYDYYKWNCCCDKKMVCFPKNWAWKMETLIVGKSLPVCEGRSESLRLTGGLTFTQGRLKRLSACQHGGLKPKPSSQTELDVMCLICGWKGIQFLHAILTNWPLSTHHKYLSNSSTCLLMFSCRLIKI